MTMLFLECRLTLFLTQIDCFSCGGLWVIYTYKIKLLTDATNSCINTNPTLLAWLQIWITAADAFYFANTYKENIFENYEIRNEFTS